ncbi:MAG: methyltransferase domain-containing protein [Candidatus Hodarchaeota archaeon]
MSKLNRFLRYISVLDILEREKGNLILEVGPGSQGVLAFWGKHLFGCDLNFGDYTATERAINPNMIPVKGSAIDLPFKTNCFDHVICVDVLEHILPHCRLGVVMECIRVSKDRITIIFPSGKNAVKFDHKLYKIWAKKEISIPGWLKEHRILEYPVGTEIEEILNKHKYAWVKKYSCWALLHYWLERYERESVLGPYISAVADFLAPRPWNNSKHKLITNIFRMIVRMFYPILFLTNIPPRYRLSFFIRKNNKY